MQQSQPNKLKNLSTRNREDSSVSCNSESNKNSRQFLNTPQHQPIIKSNQKQQQQQQMSTGLQSFPSATPTTTAGIALMQNNNSAKCNNPNGNNGSSQATNSCYTNNFVRNQSHTKLNNLNNSMDYTTPIGMFPF